MNLTRNSPARLENLERLSDSHLLPEHRLHMLIEPFIHFLIGIGVENLGWYAACTKRNFGPSASSCWDALACINLP